MEPDLRLCSLCNKKIPKVFTETVLNKYSVQYFFCNTCIFVQTEKPYWLNESYSEAIASTDTGLIMRNFSQASKLSVLIFLCLNAKDLYLDIAGGYGTLTRLMRDFGFNYFWSDPYCKNIHAIGFEKRASTEKFSAISAFEVLEHVEFPLEFISNNLKEHGSKTFIFSTELMPGIEPPPVNWWYYSFSTGQHISFYSLTALQLISRKLNLNFYSFNGIHIMTEVKLKNLWIARFLTNRYIAPICAYVIRNYLGSKTLSDSYDMSLSSTASNEVDKS